MFGFFGSHRGKDCVTACEVPNGSSVSNAWLHCEVFVRLQG